MSGLKSPTCQQNVFLTARHCLPLEHNISIFYKTDKY